MQQSSRLAQFSQFGKKIICIARNYLDHAKELGNAVPSEPVFFLKPTTAFLLPGSGSIKIPPGCSNIHFEVELGLVINQRGSDIPESSAFDFIGGYTLALDMTARDLQEKAKQKGHPWTIAKGFDTSCPISDFIPKDAIKNPQDVHLWLRVNEETQLRQDGNTRDMIFKIPTIISYISKYMTLEEGDLILTGTPSGVGAVNSGDTITAGLAELAQIKVSVK
ncbi:Acylpyruvase FAHD1, mitochondrial [Holothuria leucospilota]|uniref:Oxaloacetate tautomerase FAHD1, mitochondrial n=1 Tax=Holothuria leucospilota TaxID=206669 RepID=A0A9Q1BZZ8_HOLLE|nr:Acylpyruvase FAHD1, mitochondrial [Holothuria leucospilota]